MRCRRRAERRGRRPRSVSGLSRPLSFFSRGVACTDRSPHSREWGMPVDPRQGPSIFSFLPPRHSFGSLASYRRARSVLYALHQPSAQAAAVRLEGDCHIEVPTAGTHPKLAGTHRRGRTHRVPAISIRTSDTFGEGPPRWREQPATAGTVARGRGSLPPVG